VRHENQEPVAFAAAGVAVVRSGALVVRLGKHPWEHAPACIAAPGKEFYDIASVDRTKVGIGVIRGAPSEIVLTREIKAAAIVRIPLSPTIAADAAELLRSGKADVFGADSGVGYPAAEALPGARIVPGAFAIVRLAAALPKGRSSSGAAACCKRRSTRRASRA
jgi:polar amino acid transport system substrate-binding protein